MMQPYFMTYLWIALAVIMIIAEITTVQLVSVWFVLGALCAAAATIFTDSIILQLVVFVTVSVAALLITRPLVKKLKAKIRPLPTNANRLVGEIGVMLGDVRAFTEVGQAKVKGEVWSVKTDNPPLKEGDTVRVLAIDGAKLIVEAVRSGGSL